MQLTAKVCSIICFGNFMVRETSTVFAGYNFMKLTISSLRVNLMRCELPILTFQFINESYFITVASISLYDCSIAQGSIHHSATVLQSI